MTRGDAAGRDRRRSRARWTCRPTTPARRSGCRRAGSRSRSGSGPALFRDDDGRDRFGIADRQPEALAPAPALPGRHPRPGALRRRPLRPGLRRRPAGRRPRDPQPGPDRLRHGRRSAGRSSASGAPRRTIDRPDHAAQPVRVQGRHGQHQGRGDRRRSTSTCGSAPTTTRARLAGRRLLPRRAPDQHDHRGLGPPAAAATRRSSSAGPRARARRCRAAASSPSPTSTCRARDEPVIPRDAHIRLVHPTKHGGARMLRRGYNFVDGTDAIGGLERRAVLHRLRPRPAHPLHPDAERDGRERRADGVPQGHRVGAVRRTARHRCRASTSGPSQALFA